jgi:NitT/TauT family transport system ATP-binding protein
MLGSILHARIVRRPSSIVSAGIYAFLKDYSRAPMTTKQSAVALSIRSLAKTYPRRAAAGRLEQISVIDPISRDVAAGRFVAIIGPSGCGKSTLLEMIAGLRPTSAGEIYVWGQRVAAPHPLLGVVFQEDSTLPWRTAHENVAFGLEMQGVARHERQAISRRMLQLVGLQGFADAYPSELSGGMRQRVAIARALATDPAILLMDEPFGALDQQTRLAVGAQLLEIWHQTNKTVLFVTHDINEAIYLADEVWVLSRRPAQLKAVVPVDLPRPRGLHLLAGSEFHALAGRLWALLAPEAQAT